MSNLILVNETDHIKFSEKCNELISQGYIVSSTSCGFIDSAEYDYCLVLNAILIKKEDGNEA